MSIIGTIIQASAQAPAGAPASPPKPLPVGTPDTAPASQVVGQIQSGSIFLDKNLRLTVIILVFSMLALVLLYGLVRHERAGPFELRIFVITILIFGSLLVVAADFSGNSQLGPVIGFFGTIAGYILGRGDRPNDPPNVHPGDRHQ